MTLHTNVIRFPSNRVMQRDFAEKSIGEVRIFSFDDINIKVSKDRLSEQEHIERFLLGRRVVLGWRPFKYDLVDVFYRGFVSHEIDTVDVYGNGCVIVSIKCFIEPYHLKNWKSPSSSIHPCCLLTKQQEVYFRECLKCL